MPSITNSGPYNELETVPDASGWIDESKGPREEKPSPGTSSSTSGDKPDTSGPSAPATESSLHSPVQTAESPSEPAQPPSPVQSSSASSTDGSTQETGQPQPSPQASSEASAPATLATPDPVPDSEQAIGPLEQVRKADAREAAEALIAQAKGAFERGDLDEAESLLGAAEDLDAEEAGPTIEMAREAIARKRSAQK